MLIGGFKHGGKIGKIKDDNNYFLGNEVDNFQDILLKKLDNVNKDDKHHAIFLSLTNELK